MLGFAIPLFINVHGKASFTLQTQTKHLPAQPNLRELSFVGFRYTSFYQCSWQGIIYAANTNKALARSTQPTGTKLISYKAEALGIKVEVIDESYTSQTCPKCCNRKKPNNREYTCKCGFTYHRDGVGAINIRQKYLGRLGVPVVAAMAPPVGIRLEGRCCSA